MPSAARTMIELKAIEKMRNQMNALDPVPARGGASPAAGIGGAGGGAAASAGGGKLSFALPSALDQATASFGKETETLASFERMHSGGGGGGGGGSGMGGKGSGRKAVLSTKARQRKVVGTEREEAYADKLTGRVVKHNKRKERMERLRRIY